MAYHAPWRAMGHSRMVEGACYARYLDSRFIHARYRLRQFNETTGICTLVSLMSGHVLYESVSEVSHWHRIADEYERKGEGS